MNTIFRKLSAMPYAQAHVEVLDDGSVHLFSYVTRVATVDKDGWLYVYGLYSMTTRKHIGAFVKEYAAPLTFQNAKMCYTDKVRINYITGEVQDVD
jgi:hypothetical protein